MPSAASVSYADELAADKRRKGALDEWDHFKRLDEEGRIGNSKFYYAVCNYCQAAYDRMDPKPTSSSSAGFPARIVGRKNQMRAHLEKCEYAAPCLPPELFDSTDGTGSGGGSGNGLKRKKGFKGKENSTTESGGTSRSQMPIWQFFNRTAKTENTAYYYCVCIACQNAYENSTEDDPVPPPTQMIGRRRCMMTHLKNCEHFAKLNIPIPDMVPVRARRRSGLGTPAGIAGAVSTDKAHVGLLHHTIEFALPFNWVESTNAPLFTSATSRVRAETLGGVLLKRVAKDTITKSQLEIQKHIQGLGAACNLHFTFEPVESDLLMTFCRVVQGHQSFESIPDDEEGPAPKASVAMMIKKHVDYAHEHSLLPGSIVLPLEYHSQQLLAELEPLRVLVLPSGADQLEILAQTIVTEPEFQDLVQEVASLLDPAANTAATSVPGGLTPIFQNPHTTSYLVFLAGFVDCIQRLLLSQSLILKPPSFWTALERVEAQYGPIVHWYRSMLKGSMTMAHVGYYLTSLTCSLDKDSALRPLVTQFWRSYDPDLVLLAMALHPKVKLSVFTGRYAIADTFANLAEKYFKVCFGGSGPSPLLKEHVKLYLENSHDMAAYSLEEVIEQLRGRKYDELAQLMSHLTHLSNSALPVRVKRFATDTMSQWQYCRAIEPWIARSTEECWYSADKVMRILSKQIKPTMMTYHEPYPLFPTADQLIQQSVDATAVLAAADPFQSTSTVII